MSTRAKIIAGVALVAAAATVGTYLFSTNRPAPSAALQSLAPDTTSDSHASVGASRTSPTVLRPRDVARQVPVANAPVATTSPALLPNTKVKDVVALLKADADRGVPQAACRVGEELMRCWELKQRLAILDTVQANLGAVPPDSDRARTLRDRVASISTSVQSDRDLCEGVEDSESKDAWRYLLRAALGGSATAQAQFAINPPLSAQDPVGSLDGWNAYTQYSPTFLRSAIQAGNVRALYLGYFSAATGMGPGGQAIGGRDPYQALVYAQALLPLVDSGTAQRIQAQISRLQSEVLNNSAQAAQEGEALRDKYFGSTPPTDVTGQLGKIDPSGCAQ